MVEAIKQPSMAEIPAPDSDLLREVARFLTHRVAMARAGLFMGPSELLPKLFDVTAGFLPAPAFAAAEKAEEDVQIVMERVRIQTSLHWHEDQPLWD